MRNEEDREYKLYMEMVAKRRKGLSKLLARHRKAEYEYTSIIAMSVLISSLDEAIFNLTGYSS